MDRRHFFKQLASFAFLLFEAKRGFASAFQEFLSGFSSSKLSVYPAGGAAAVQIPLFWKGGIAYVSAFQLSGALQYHTYFNEEKRKIVIYFPQNKLLISADNPYILIDNQPLQMPAKALWENNEIFAPLSFLIPLINKYSNLRMDFNEKSLTLHIVEKRFNVTNINIEAKENGTVVRIATSLNFRPGEMSLTKRYQWHHIDLYGAKADLELLRKTPLGGLIRQIKVDQLGELLSIAFLLRQEPLSSEIYQYQFNNEVVAVFRTKEEIQLEQNESTAHESSDNDEIQQQLDEERKRWLIDTVVIDPGHGGKDPGAIGVKKTYEKDIVLDVGLKLGKIIKKNMPGVKVIYTRKSDRFIELKRRTQIANENNAKVFISIHVNSNRKKNVNGFESYILGPEKGESAKEVVLKENAVINFEDPSSQKEYQGINVILATMAQSAFMRQSEHLASMIQEEMDKKLKALNMKNRGVKQAPFWVMVGASMPSVLTEIGFITNSYEARILKTGSYQQRIAEGIFNGLRRFKKDYENAI
jgi:N-acetylmuramoyl-L-alanine amidase